MATKARTAARYSRATSIAMHNGRLLGGLDPKTLDDTLTKLVKLLARDAARDLWAEAAAESVKAPSHGA